MFRSLWKILFPAYPLHENKTVRYAFPVVLFAAIFAGVASVAVNQGSYISITTTPSTVKEGEQIYIDVRATAHVPVNAVDLVITYPESQLTIESIDTGTSVITLWTEPPYAKNGKIYLRGGTFRRGFVGEHPIVRIQAKARAGGLAHVIMDSATFIAGDGKGTLVDVNDIGSQETRVSISPSTLGKLEGEARIGIVTDLDGDGKVDLRDISAFMAAWFTKGKTFDFNGDGKMSFRDFSILLADSFFK